MHRDGATCRDFGLAEETVGAENRVVDVSVVCAVGDGVTRGMPLSPYHPHREVLITS